MNIINIIYRSPTVVKDDNLDRSPFYPYPLNNTNNLKILLQTSKAIILDSNVKMMHGPTAAIRHVNYNYF